MATSREHDVQEVNLEEAAELIAALERDLEKVTGDSRDIQRLRDEVETLRNVLNSPVRRHHWVRDGYIDSIVRDSVPNTAPPSSTTLPSSAGSLKRKKIDSSSQGRRSRQR